MRTTPLTVLWDTPVIRCARARIELDPEERAEAWFVPRSIDSRSAS
jgi:hypothetical protein